MKHPQRWRETCDPFRLPLTDFRICEVLGYPHAGNDVFHVRGMLGGAEITAYLKVARQKGAAVDNEVNILQQLDAPIFPKVIDYDRTQGQFSVTTELPGSRLSAIVGDNENLDALSYMEEYGKALGRLHQLRLSAGAQADRKFFYRPSAEMLKKQNLTFLSDYFSREPEPSEIVFCHGDFHYANVLWQDHRISAVLDFELAGYGSRDFDIAWALFRRPGQKFLKTEAERDLFLKGYQTYGTYHAEAVRYYMAQCYVYFLCFSGDDPEYCQYVRNWLTEHCK